MKDIKFSFDPDSLRAEQKKMQGHIESIQNTIDEEHRQIGLKKENIKVLKQAQVDIRKQMKERRDLIAEIEQMKEMERSKKDKSQ